MFRALVEAAQRFPELPPEGYAWRDIDWVLEICTDSTNASLVKFGKGELRKMLPTIGDRAGKVSEENLKPTLLADKAAYALGMRVDHTLDANCAEHRGFKSLITQLEAEWPNDEPSRILAFLDLLHRDDDHVKQKELRQEIMFNVKPNEVVAFRTTADSFPFESISAQMFWRRQLESKYARREGQCCLCGCKCATLRILPSQVSFAGYSCPISSFNESAFNSFGRDQTANSPLCFGCASKATRVLQLLLDSEGHHRVLASDDRLGGGKSPLRNQWAVFWLRQQEQVEAPDGSTGISLEEIFATPLSSLPRGNSTGPPADPAQIQRLYGLPFSTTNFPLQLDQNRFHLAVLSPNKSRLVLRAWIEESAECVVRNLASYDTARTIQTADGKEDWKPDIPAILDALRPPQARSASNEPNLIRSLLQTAYRGTQPPVRLLERAVLRSRIDVRSNARSIQEEIVLDARRQTLVAAIKLVLTYGKKEAITLQRLDKQSRSGSYLCGQLLAILEEAQSRASRWGVRATLVDRYYGGASTSPSITFSVLINQGTKAHMPKIRKAGLGYQCLEQSLERVLSSIDDQGGFPVALTLREQGEFALGFYHQRAYFRESWPLKKNEWAINNESIKENSK